MNALHEFWLNRKLELDAGALGLWRKADEVTERRIDEPDEDVRRELQAQFEQIALAAEIVEFYSRRAYRHAWVDPMETVDDWAADWPWADKDEEDLRGLYAYGI